MSGSRFAYNIIGSLLGYRRHLPGEKPRTTTGRGQLYDNIISYNTFPFAPVNYLIYFFKLPPAADCISNDNVLMFLILNLKTNYTFLKGLTHLLNETCIHTKYWKYYINPSEIHIFIFKQSNEKRERPDRKNLRDSILDLNHSVYTECEYLHYNTWTTVV